MVEDPKKRVLTSSELKATTAFFGNDFLHGIYISPREITTHEVPTVIVDPHNEVFSYWMQHRHAVVIHIDDHSDMTAGAREKWDTEDFAAYQSRLSIGRFILPAIHYEGVSAVYWFKPYEPEKIQSTGIIVNHRVLAYKKTEVRDGRIEWANSYFACQFPSPTEVIKELRGYNGLLIVDIDLDAIENYWRCITDLTIEDREKIITQNLRRVSGFLQEIPRPNLITIARSQNPEAYVDPRKVNCIEEKTLEALQRIYEKQ